MAKVTLEPFSEDELLLAAQILSATPAGAVRVRAALKILLALADAMLGDIERDARTGGAVHSVYLLRRLDTHAIIYVGRAIDPDAREREHRRAARNPNKRVIVPIAEYLGTLEDQGIPWRMEIYQDQMTVSEADILETDLITLLRRQGVRLLNVKPIEPEAETA